MKQISRMPEYDKDLTRFLSKRGESLLRVDCETLNEDIAKFKEKEASARGKRDKHNLANVQVYLRALGSCVKDGHLRLKWEYCDGILRATPVDLRMSKPYNLSATDYIVVDNGKMIKVDFWEIANGIAFELMQRDLGETHESLEELFSDVGILVPNAIEELNKRIGTDNHMQSYTCMIEQSPYLDKDEKALKDYFFEGFYRDKTYRKAVEASCRKAAAIIVWDLMDKLAGPKDTVMLCGAYETEAYLSVISDRTIDVKDIEETYVFKVCGRKFRCTPTLTVY